jgi:hypothetical protein
MSFTQETLAAIQKAGSAVFDADAQLKLAVKAYGERVHAAVGLNPYHLGNDALFGNWKLVSRLAQTMAGIEEELRKVYQVAVELCDDEPLSVTAMPALSAPARASTLVVEPMQVQQSDLAATDIKVKKKTGATVKIPVAAKTTPAPLPKNAMNLLKHLSTVLSVKHFSSINQTAASRATGIPLGSMTAALKRLTTGGQIVTGPAGQYKLAK